jgi:hypothetical protein
MSRKDIYKSATNGFKQNPQNINRKGPPRKTISLINNELELLGFKEASNNDVKSCYMRLINVDIPTLQSMISDDQQPSLVRIVGKAIISGKGFDVLEQMLNRAIGKSTTNIDVTTQGEKIAPIIIDWSGKLDEK